jgi:branched-chain amino acid transport system substrate-binding protein
MKRKCSSILKGENFVLIIVFILFILMLGAIAVEPVAAERNEIRVGVSISLSGALGGLGQEAKAGMEYAVADINESGGISVAEGANLPVKLIVYDDKSDQTVSVGNFERLITVDKVDFLLGHVATHIIMADAGVAERYGVPYLTAGITKPEVHKGQAFKWTWVVFHRADLQFQAVRDMIKKVAPNMPKKVVLWKENTVLGEVVEKGELPRFKNAGWEIASIPYAKGSKDFTDLILKTKQKNAAVIIGTPIPPDAIAMVRQMKELNYMPQMVFWPRGASVIQFSLALKSDAEGIADSVAWSPNVNYPGNRALSKRYKDGTGRIAAAVLGPSYACAQVLFDSIKRAGTLDRKKVRDAIQKTDMDTVNGRLTFPDQGSPIVKVIINQWQKGDYVVIWPEDVAFAKPEFPITPWNKR